MALGQLESVLDTSKQIILLKEKSYGVTFHSRGWGLKFSKGFNKTAFSRRTWAIELVEMQSPKQIKIINPFYTNAKSYIYGKLNTVFDIRGSIGNYKQLNRKPYWGGVEMRMFYMGGVSVGIAKPVYLYILKIIPSPSSDLKYTTSVERYDPDIHPQDDIFGRASFTKGFNELSFYPGIHVKVGLDFDYASYRTKIQSLEIGAMLEFFPRAIPIMANNDPEHFFPTFYLNFSFGKRYN